MLHYLSIVETITRSKGDFDSCDSVDVTWVKLDLQPIKGVLGGTRIQFSGEVGVRVAVDHVGQVLAGGRSYRREDPLAPVGEVVALARQRGDWRESETGDIECKKFQRITSAVIAEELLNVIIFLLVTRKN